MSDPLRHEDGPSASDTGRESRIEELLLAGLDHYFAGQYELAVNVWTRVLFLDRTHARARAYIERARGAIAERQREGEELLHTGAAAFNRGDAPAARRLLTSAVERGAPAEEALALLDRLDRLAPAPDAVERAARGARRSGADAGASEARADHPFPSALMAFTLTVVLLAAGALILWQSGGLESWRPAGAAHTAPSTLDVQEPLPVPSTGDVWLSRARALHEQGRLREALAALDGIRRGDAQHAEADLLRAAIQRELLAAARARPVPAGPSPQ